MCNKSEAGRPDFFNLRSDTCPQCGSLTSAIRVPHRPVTLEDGSSLRGYSNFKACIPCATNDDILLTKVGRVTLCRILKSASGVSSNDFGLLLHKHASEIYLDLLVDC
jgi:hypothetical protein